MASGTWPICWCGSAMWQVRSNRWPAEAPVWRCPIKHGHSDTASNSEAETPTDDPIGPISGGDQ